MFFFGLSAFMFRCAEVTVGVAVLGTALVCGVLFGIGCGLFAASVNALESDHFDVV